MVRLTDRPYMTLDVYRGLKQQCNIDKMTKKSLHRNIRIDSINGLNINLKRARISFNLLFIGTNVFNFCCGLKSVLTISALRPSLTSFSDYNKGNIRQICCQILYH